MIFVISGPSGCGKSTLVKTMLTELEGVEFSVSFTTRPKRETEIEGKDYFFVTEEKFKKMIREGKLVEWALVHGHYYGTSRREIEKKSGRNHILLDIDVQGAKEVKDKFKKAVYVFILPPRFQELKRRLENRAQDSRATIKSRLEEAKREIRCYPEFDFIIVNDQLENAVKELKAIIVSQNCRLDSRQKEIGPILQSFQEGG